MRMFAKPCTSSDLSPTGSISIPVLCLLGIARGGRRWAGGAPLTTRLPVTAAPEPLEAYAAQCDDLFAQRSQRDGFRRYLEGVLLPAERHKTLTGLANTAPDVGAQHPRAP